MFEQNNELTAQPEAGIPTAQNHREQQPLTFREKLSLVFQNASIPDNPKLEFTTTEALDRQMERRRFNELMVSAAGVIGIDAISPKAYLPLVQFGEVPYLQQIEELITKSKIAMAACGLPCYFYHTDEFTNESIQESNKDVVVRFWELFLQQIKDQKLVLFPIANVDIINAPRRWPDTQVKFLQFQMSQTQTQLTRNPNDGNQLQGLNIEIKADDLNDVYELVRMMAHLLIKPPENFLDEAPDGPNVALQMLEQYLHLRATLNLPTMREATDARNRLETELNSPPLEIHSLYEVPDFYRILATLHTKGIDRLTYTDYLLLRSVAANATVELLNQPETETSLYNARFYSYFAGEDVHLAHEFQAFIHELDNRNMLVDPDGHHYFCESGILQTAARGTHSPSTIYLNTIATTFTDNQLRSRGSTPFLGAEVATTEGLTIYCVYETETEIEYLTLNLADIEILLDKNDANSGGAQIILPEKVTIIRDGTEIELELETLPLMIITRLGTLNGVIYGGLCNIPPASTAQHQQTLEEKITQAALSVGRPQEEIEQRVRELWSRPAQATPLTIDQLHAQLKNNGIPPKKWPSHLLN